MPMKKRNYPFFPLLLFNLVWTWMQVHASQSSTMTVVGNDNTTPLVDDSCRGRRIFMYDLPEEFNTKILNRCEFGLARWVNLCPLLANDGFGQPYKSSLGDGWFDTDSYMLEIIFHERLKRYRCLTPDPALADAVFVPYYAGLDALSYLYPRPYGALKSSHGVEIMSWLTKRGEWKRKAGRDHFMLLGRTAWDFGINEGGWGTGMLELPGINNMTMFTIERRSWKPNEQAVPYPTSFHPSSKRQIEQWTNRVRGSTRSRLFSFAGSVRPYVDDGGFRNLLMRLCARSPGSCLLLDCRAARCNHEAEPVMRAFMKSIFCLQPPGDTPTRRSTFDAVIAGCIPVFFHIDSAYTQYTWHLPSGGEEGGGGGGGGGYSVYIPQNDVVADESVVERVLRGLSPERVREMQENVVRLIPRVIYMMRSTSEEPVEDAFDISVEGMVEKVSQQQQLQAEMAAAGIDDGIDIR